MKELAIMHNIQFGVYDRDKAALWFNVDMLGRGALLCLYPEQAIELIEKYGITDIKNLEGAPCIVDIEDGIVRFDDLYKRG